MISLSWVARLVAVFVFPISDDYSSREYSVRAVSTINGLAQLRFNAGPDILEIPEFKVDWSLNSKLNPDWYFDLLSPSKAYLSPSFLKSHYHFLTSKIPSSIFSILGKIE